MYINGSDPENPIFLVDARGNYLMNPDGTYVLFTGEAHVEPGGTVLTSASGYYLVDTDGSYFSAPTPAAPVPRASASGFPTAASSLKDAPIQAGATQASALPAAQGASSSLPPSIPPARRQPSGLATTATIPAQRPAQPPAQARREIFPSADLRSAAEKHSDRRNTAIVILALLLIAAIAGFGLLVAKNVLSSSETPAENQSEPTAVAEQSDTATPIQTASEAPASQTPGEEATTAEPTQLPVPAGVFPGAGRNEAPAGAGTMATEGGIAYVTAPSGNITCAFGPSISECRIASWAQTQPYGRSGGANGNEWPNSKVAFGADGSPSVGPVSDAIPKIGTLPYGSAAVSGKWACGSAQNGLTCWNTETGHGAIMNRDGYQAF